MQRRIEDSLTLKRNSNASLSPSSSICGKMLPLTDRNLFAGCPQLGFSDSNARINVDVFRYGGNSPPPPALSPANSSPAHVNNTHTRASSPSPPVIDAEMTENSSESLRAMGHKDPNIVGTDKGELSVFCRQSNRSYSCLSIKPLPRLKSSTSSSSSSTLSSSTATGSGEQLKDSLPILEKISIVLGSPRGNCNQALPLVRPYDTAISYSQQDQLETQASVPLIPIDIQTNDTENLSNLQDKTQPSGSAPLPLDIKSPLKASLNTTASAARARGGGRITAGAKRRTRSKRKQPSFSDDDDSAGGVGFGGSTKVPRRISGVSAVLKRVKQKAGLQRVSSAANPLEGNTTSSEAAARRYLESPFFCLCQSDGISGGIFTNPTTPENELGITQNSNNSEISSTKLIAAHLISPAMLSGLSSLGSGTGVQSLSSTSLSFPPNCPLAPAGLNNKPNERGDPLDQSQSDSRNMFTGLTYRPSLPTRLPASTVLDSKVPWCCAFCGEDNHMAVEVGSLYGPYWLTANEVSQLPANLVNAGTGDRQVDSTSGPLVATTSKYSAGQSQLSGLVAGCAPTASAGSGIRSPGGGRCQGVTRSNSRRTASSSLSNCNGATAKTDGGGNGGGLRLVIKAPNPKKPKAMAVSYPPSSTATPSQSEGMAMARVGLNGEVWVHMECVLWAPGTYLLGNGVIGGLGEALQLALDVACSHCDKPGAVLSCCYRGCNLSYHYRCAFKAGCQLNPDQFSLVCRKHHVYS